MYVFFSNHLEPDFTPWTPWSACSVPCGIGKRTRTRKCVDLAHHNQELDRMECINKENKPLLDAFYNQEDKCDAGGCAGKKVNMSSDSRPPKHAPQLLGANSLKKCKVGM